MKIDFSAIKQNASIVNIVKNYGIDVNHGEMCNCPFHAEKTSSMKLYTDSNQYHCFGCGEHGDVIDFVAKMERLSIYEAAKKLNDEYGLGGSAQVTESRPLTSKPKYDKIYSEPQEPEPDYTAFFRRANNNLNRTDYHRGISTETLNRFHVGFIADWRHPKAPASVPTSPRLIIPTSESSYLARDTRPVLNETEKKYAKSKVGKVHIFNQEVLKTAKSPIFVVEGEIDAMSIIDTGGETVALGSVANVNKFLELVRNQKPEQPIIIVRDNDVSGIKGETALDEGLKELKVEHYKVNLSEPYKDVNEALLNNRQSLQQKIAYQKELHHKKAPVFQTKYEKYAQLADDTLHGLTKSKENWTSFLNTASRMYKYSLEEQILIHAQRPDSRACANFDLWTSADKMNLHIKRGAKGIALIDRDTKKLHYVYAMEDTEPRENGKSRNPENFIWKLAPEKADTINQILCENGNIPQTDNIEQTIIKMAYAAVKKHLSDYDEEFRMLYKKTSPDIPAEILRVQFAETMAESAAYMALKRCGLNADTRNFRYLDKFNTELSGLLAKGTGDMAQQVLRQIERTVHLQNKLERNYHHEQSESRSITENNSRERNQVYSGRENRNLSSGLSGGTGGNSGTNRTFRTDEREIPEGTLRSNLRHDAPAERTERTSAADRRTGMGNGAGDSQVNGGTGRNGRETETNRPVEMDRSDEQLPSGGRGNYSERTDLRLSEKTETIQETAAETKKEKVPAVSVSETFEEKIHTAFSELTLNRSFSANQKKLLDRLEKYAIQHKISENLLDSALENSMLWRQVYGNKKRISMNIFNGRWGAVENELNAALEKQFSSEMQKQQKIAENIPEQKEEITEPIIKESIPQDTGVRLSREQFVEIASNTLAKNPTVQNAHKNSTEQDYKIEIQSELNKFFTAVISGSEDIGYTVSEVSPFYNAFQSNETLRNQIYDIVSENVDITLTIAEKEVQKTEPETDDFSDIDTQTIKENLKSVGIVNGEVKEPEKLNQSPFIQKVEKVVQEQSEVLEEQLTFDEIDTSEPEKQEKMPIVSEQQLTLDEAVKPKSEKHDFIITDESLGEGGAKSKFHANISAIETLKQIESENRMATPEEQEILSKYVGWGGIPQAFDESNEKWAKEYTQLKELLAPEEYESAKGSVLNAHYTSPLVIDAMYEAIRNNGFQGGRILEPAAGIGNFLGKMPEEIRQKSRLDAVELDSISGRITQQLYQSAKVHITGFEKTDFKDNAFDLAIGNIPFGGYSLHEKKYDKNHFLIHDHFFAKSLDKVKSGGIVAFITSKGTLDKHNPDVRKYLAERAELVGAIRLPNNAFKANAGTEVTTDIVFLQKRENPIELTPETTPDWVHLGQTKDGLPINQYFADNPQMVLGQIVQGNKLYGHGEEDTMCIPLENADLKQLLHDAISQIHFQTRNFQEIQPEMQEQKKTEIPLGTKNFSYAVVEDKLYFRNGEEMQLFEGNASDADRIRNMIAIRDCLHELISMQLENASDEDVQAQQKKLNTLYDDFTKKYGLINSRPNQRAFKEDVSLPMVSSLENFKGDKFIGKAAIFEKRTILPKREITSVDTSAEALAVSLSEKACVDMEFMKHLTGFEESKILEDLQGVVYRNPMKPDENGNPHLETADEYLSGNIRKKLEFMQEHFADVPEYAGNITALQTAMPKPLKASEIDVRLGVTWLKPELIQKFMYEQLKTPVYYQDMGERSNNNIWVDFSPVTAEWCVINKSSDRYNRTANAKFGTKRRTAYQLFEDCLNQRDTRVMDRVERNGKEVSVLNQKETELAQEKQKQIQAAFKEWIFAEPERRESVVQEYNRLFNSTRPREYDGSHLEFSGMNSEIQLRTHQKNAIAHALYGGNTLFAHEVGAGKTFEMIASAMEGKRLGLHNKALLCVPNHLTEQIGADFMKLYPNANILVATAADFSKQNRKRLFAKIATGDFDAIIIGHSQLIKLPISAERQERLLRKQIDEIVAGIQEIKHKNGEHFQIKQMELAKKALDSKLNALLDAPVRDDVMNFEELGVDKLIVDEAHLFKNLFISTKMRNISGISTNDNVQKTFDLFLKCQYLDEITGGKGIIFSTGTPVSNSLSEIYSMMKYLQSGLLEETGLQHFDAWAANFAETVTESQLAPEGNGYQMKTRFAKFCNLPELMAIFKECADIKTADMLHLPVPECTMETIIAQPTDTQKEMIKALGERAKRIRMGGVDPKKDNMPMITNDGRKIGLDQRFMNPDLPDEQGSKLNLCVDNVFQIWNETAEQRSTQLIFCDLGVPQSSEDVKKNGRKFSVYEDIKEKLIAKGVPPEEIAFIHDAKTETAKDKLFAKVRKGETRILIGSTSKMGAGTNVQDKLIASHDLDAPWKPSDMEQRRGRMVRQGNENKHVHLYRYVTEGTFDAYLYQMLENKQKFISQIMTSKSPVRSCLDVDEIALSFAEIKALSAGNPLIKEKMDLDVDVAKLRMFKANHENTQFELQDNVLKVFPQQIARLKSRIEALQKDISAYSALPVRTDEKGNTVFPSMEIGGKIYTEKADAGTALLDALRQNMLQKKAGETIGHYQGFAITSEFDTLRKCYVASLHGSAVHMTDLGTSETGNITRLDNLLQGLPKELTKSEALLADTIRQLEESKKELGKPFPREEELQEKEKRLDELTKLLEIDGQGEELVEITEPFLIELGSQAQLDKLRASGIPYKKAETSDGKLIVKVNRKDKEAAQNAIRLEVSAIKNVI